MYQLVQINPSPNSYQPLEWETDLTGAGACVCTIAFLMILGSFYIKQEIAMWFSIIFVVIGGVLLAIGREHTLFNR